MKAEIIMRKTLSFLLAFAMVFSMLPPAVSAAAEETVDSADTYAAGVTASGTCGKYTTAAITWVLYEDGTLEFTGTGQMADKSTPAWNDYDSSITKVVVNEGITTVGKNAFDDCTNLTEVSLPTSLITIGDEAFSDCTSLASIVIPEGTQRISEESFYGCTSLSSISLPNTLTTIENYAFWYCTSLTEIDLPESLTKIEYGAFSTCTGFTTIEIPKGITYIDSFLVRECSNLKSFELWYTVKSIDYGAFNDCTSLSQIIFHGTQDQWNAITLDTTVTYVLSKQNVQIVYVDPCEEGHTEVVDAYVAPTCTATGLTEGKHCSACGEVLVAQEVIPAGHDLDENGVCQTCGIITGTCGENLIWTLTNDGTLTVSGEGEMEDDPYWDGYGGYFSTITTVIIEDGVTSIGENAFANFTKLSSVTISDSVVSIGEAAFNNCGSLKSIDIPASVTDIGLMAFTFCDSLKQFCVDENNTAYSSDDVGMLFNKDKTTLICCPGGFEGHYTVPDGVTTIGDWAFGGGIALTSITIPDSVTVIGYAAFDTCEQLTGITIPGSVKSIGGQAFLSCSSMTSVTLENGLVSIGESAFSHCTGITSITIPESVTSIGDFAFLCCTNLEKIIIAENNSVYSSNDAGMLCNKDETKLIYCPAGFVGAYDIPENITSIAGWAFSDCDKLTSITIPGSVASIPDGAFSGCDNLANITLSEGVNEIEGTAFSRCNSLTSIEIPSSVTSIGSYAYGWCDSLTEITFEGDAPSFGSYVFCDVTATAYFPGKNTTWTSDIMQDYGGTIEWKGIYVYIEDDLSWTLDEEGTLTISGEGPMSDYLLGAEAEWFEQCEDIKKIVIESGVTSIGDWAFHGCKNLTEVVIPDTVVSIGECAFASCSMTEITIPASVKTLAYGVLDNCTNLETVTFQGDAPEFNEYGMFYAVTATAYYPADNTTWTSDVMQDYGGTITWVAVKATVAKIGETEYETVSEALAAAKSGDTVTLTADAVESYVLVTPGVTLNLNGCTLTADYVSGFNGSNVVDSTRTGLLKVANGSAILSKSNTEMAFWTGEGYKFGTFKTANKAAPVVDENGSLAFSFYTQGSGKLLGLVTDNGTSDNDVSVVIRLTWNTDTGTAYQNYVYNDTQVATVGAGGYSATFELSNCTELKDLTLTAVIISETGIEVFGASYLINE